MGDVAPNGASKSLGIRADLVKQHLAGVVAEVALLRCEVKPGGIMEVCYAGDLAKNLPNG